MVRLSKRPVKESKWFGIVTLAFGVLSLFVWFIGIPGFVIGIRGVVLSRGAHNKRYLAFSIIGMVLSLASLVYYFVQ